MKATGEQVILGKSSFRTQEEHESRYKFATAYVQGARVLDIACGTGYGAPMLLTAGAKEYTGVDISPEAITFAEKRYATAHSRFIRASVDEELFSEGAFDVICSFETIEHLKSDVRAAYLKNMRHWLVPGGTLLLSTPNKKITSPFTDIPLNKFHVLEYYRDELLEEVTPYFSVEEVYGQRLVKKIFSYPLVRRCIRVLEIIAQKQFDTYNTPTGPEVVLYDERLHEPRLFVLVCHPHK